MSLACDQVLAEAEAIARRHLPDLQRRLPLVVRTGWCFYGTHPEYGTGCIKVYPLVGQVSIVYARHALAWFDDL